MICLSNFSTSYTSAPNLFQQLPLIVYLHENSIILLGIEPLDLLTTALSNGVSAELLSKLELGLIDPV